MIRETFSCQKAGYQMTAEVTLLNGDGLVIISGGDLPHLGTVNFYSPEKMQLVFSESEAVKEVTIPDFSLKTVRFSSHSGRFHKEDVLAEAFLAAVKNSSLTNWLITAGVHINGITQEQIEASYKMAKNLGEQTAHWLQTIKIEKIAPRYQKKD